MMDNKNTIQSVEDLLACVLQPDDIVMDCSSFNRGIDNYHVDVHLSDSFILQTSLLVESIVKRVIAGSRAIPGNSDELEHFRNAFNDMMRTTFHRAKTDLQIDTIRFLQFGVVKFVLVRTRFQLDAYTKQLEDNIAQQQYAGSRNLLPTQEKLAWFRKHYNEFLYRTNRAIFQQLQREENGHLRGLRAQLLGCEFPELLNLLYNPMLTAGSPTDILLLVENYGFWSGSGPGFNEINTELEHILQAGLKALSAPPLKPLERRSAAQSEVFDELYGLFAVQNLLGPSDDQSNEVKENFTWLEQPGNVRFLFDSSVHDVYLQKAKDAQGMLDHRGFKSELKSLLKLVSEIREKLFPEKVMKEALAAYLLREKWISADKDTLSLELACAYVAGNDTKKILSKLDLENESTGALLKRLDEISVEVNRLYKEELEEKFLRLLSDFCRYRLHLKYYRFAHRIINRIRLISEPEELQLARAGGKLYELLRLDESQELEVKEPEIIHHVIIKADIRGSTKVISELLKKGLNPASYFSLRFFDPLTLLLEKYGASKVFIEGDAIILCIYERSDEPHQWYCAARACGIAKDVIDIVNSKNAHSKQTDLPKLEVGIGISFCPEKPLFLFDEDKPIMISPAIGDADRLSSCSWKLRDTFSNSKFNVEVLEIADEDRSKGEKGQDKIRYNVNGILLDDESFAKLKSEVLMKKVNIKVNDQTQIMYVTKFPDIMGKERDLVIREGKIHLWQDGKVGGDSQHGCFYEILPSSKLTSQVLEAARAK